MIRRLLLALMALTLAIQPALADEAVNYEISSYVMYVTILT